MKYDEQWQVKGAILFPRFVVYCYFAINDKCRCSPRGSAFSDESYAFVIDLHLVNYF